MARCKVEGCGTLVTCSNTTNLSKHVQRNHLELWYLDVKSGKKVLLMFDTSKCLMHQVLFRFFT